MKRFVVIALLVAVAVGVVWYAWMVFWWLGPNMANAVIMLDEDYCIKAYDNPMRYACLRGIAALKGAAVCEKIPSGELIRYGCFRDIAVRDGNYSICYNETEFEDEKGMCVAFVGIETGNPEICDEINDEFVRAWCYDKFAVYSYYRDYRGAQKDPGLCEKIPKQEGGRPFASRVNMFDVTPRDDCFWLFGECNMIENAEARNQCDMFS